MEKPKKDLLAIDHKMKHLWLHGETSILYVSSSQITEIRIIQTKDGFNIYAKVNLVYRFEDHLLETKKTLAAAKRFVENFTRDLQREEFVKDFKGTTYIKKKHIIGFSVVETDLVALVTNNLNPIKLASYETKKDALEALEHFISTETYKTEKIRSTETETMNILMEEVDDSK